MFEEIGVSWKTERERSGQWAHARAHTQRGNLKSLLYFLRQRNGLKH